MSIVSFLHLRNFANIKIKRAPKPFAPPPAKKPMRLPKKIGQSIGKAVSIEEKDIDGYRSPYANASSNSFAIDGNEIVENETVGTISVKAQVRVRFLLN